MSDEKEKLIEKIKMLIDENSTHCTNTIINAKYIEYFEIDELEEIIDNLINKKKAAQESTSSYLDEIFSKCS